MKIAGDRVRVFFSLTTIWVCGALFVSLIAVAQNPTATISGVVKDSTGAVVPGASLTVTNTDTGLTRSGPSGPDGSYKFPALPVGHYEVRAEHAGFQASVQKGLTL